MKAWMLLCAGLVLGCRGPLPSAYQAHWGAEPAVFVKSVRIPDTEPWQSRFAQHTFFDLRTKADGTWMRMEVLNRTSGVLILPVTGEEVFSDQRWGRRVEVLAAYRGPEGAALARAALAAGEAQRERYVSGYRAWPGPNSNTFAEAVLREVDGLSARLDHNAVGKDWAFPLRAGVSGTGAGVELETPLVGVQLGLVEGVEVHLLGLSFAVSLVPPTLGLPFLPPLRLVSRARVEQSSDGDWTLRTPQ